MVLSISAEPNWQRINYRDSTVFSGIVTLDDKPVNIDDMLGAFVNNECRMVTKVFKNNDSTYVSSVIHGEKPVMRSFYFWVKAEDKIYELKNLVLSKPGDGLYMYHLNFKKK